MADSDLHLRREDRGPRHIPRIHPLQRRETITGNDDRPSGKQTVPEKRFTLEWVVLAEDERGPQRRHRNALLAAEDEERSLGVGFVGAVRVDDRLLKRRGLR